MYLGQCYHVVSERIRWAFKQQGIISLHNTWWYVRYQPGSKAVVKSNLFSSKQKVVLQRDRVITGPTDSIDTKAASFKLHLG